MSCWRYTVELANVPAYRQTENEEKMYRKKKFLKIYLHDFLFSHVDAGPINNYYSNK